MEYEKYKFDEYLIEDIMASLLNYVDTKLISDIVKEFFYSFISWRRN